MIRITQLKLNYRHTEDDMMAKIAGTLRIHVQDIESYKIVRRSIDARQRGADQGQILFIYESIINLFNNYLLFIFFISNC